jgi:hypothetical protein
LGVNVTWKLWRLAAMLAVVLGLTGCVVYEPGRPYYGGPAYYPAYGYVGGGWHHDRWR